MIVSVATATFYFLPFEETLDIISEAGFENIELDLFWEWGDWAMAQHLKDLPIHQAIRAIHHSGLKVSSIHDGGGVLPDHKSVAGYINPRLDEYLDQLGYAPVNLVFHSPHTKGDLDGNWWKQISGEIALALDPYRTVCKHLTLENEPFFDGFTVPLVTPEALYSFVIQNGLGVTVDTTHYAYMGTDILEAARILQGSVRSVHLSDYQAGRIHVFVGEGDLDLAGFLRLVNSSVLDAVTLECSVSSVDKPDRQMNHAEMVNRLKLAKARVEGFIGDEL